MIELFKKKLQKLENISISFGLLNDWEETRKVDTLLNGQDESEIKSHK